MTPVLSRVAGLDRSASGDPRPDLYRDHPRWEALLLAAFDAHPQPHPLYGALNCMRCLGATLQDGKIVPPLEVDQGYQEMRAALVPHAPWLTNQIGRLQQAHPLVETPPPETGLVLVVFADGGLAGPNDGNAFMTVGWVLCQEDGQTVVQRGGQVIEEAGTNNQAEYHALITALKAARGFGADRAIVKMDSQLVIRQMQQRFRVNEGPLTLLHTEALRQAALLPQGVEYAHVERMITARADNEGRKALKAWRARQRPAPEKAPVQGESPA